MGQNYYIELLSTLQIFSIRIENHDKNIILSFTLKTRVNKPSEFYDKKKKKIRLMIELMGIFINSAFTYPSNMRRNVMYI